MPFNPGIIGQPNKLQRKLQESSSNIKETSYSGADIIAYINIPILDDPEQIGTNVKNARILGEVQTISISSTRSVSPVRVLGRSNPVGYTRGGRTFAGSLIFASFGKDVFSDLYRPDVAESFADSSTSLFVDQLPPFTIIVTACNELGGLAQQIISGITLINYGTVYSIDDMYTEQTYTFVATDVTPLLPSQVLRGLAIRSALPTPHSIGKYVISDAKLEADLDTMKKSANRHGYSIRDLDSSLLESAHGLTKDEYRWVTDRGQQAYRPSTLRTSLRDVLK